MTTDVEIRYRNASCPRKHHRQGGKFALEKMTGSLEQRLIKTTERGLWVRSTVRQCRR